MIKDWWKYLLILLIPMIIYGGIGYLLGVAYPYKKEVQKEYIVYLKDYKTEVYQNEKEKFQINNKYSIDTIYWSRIFPDSLLYPKLMEYSRQLHSADTLR